MVPSRASGGLTQSPSSSGIYYQGDGQSQALANSPLSSPFCNSSSNSVAGIVHPNLGSVSGDMNNVALNSAANSGPSVAASSLVTDANSALSSGPHLQRSASINTDSYIRLPASPISFSSNNISISGSSVMDGPSVAQPNSHQDQTVDSMLQNHLHPLGAASSPVIASQNGQVLLPVGTRIPGSYIHDPNTLSQLVKKPRLDIKQEDIQQQVLQQLLQRQDSMQLQGRNLQLQALFQQQQKRMRQQQQNLQSTPHMQRAQLQQQQQQQQLQLRQMQQQGIQQMNVMKRPFDGGVCARRLMQYLFHQRQQPADNPIAYWRKFVAEYYSPRAKKRWCLSLYDNVGQHALGVFPQAAMECWQCDICSAKSGRGFEATFEVLPRLNEIKFGSGVIDELLFLDWPREYRYPSGIMMLEYAKAVQESVYEQLRVVREGKLRIIFAQDLKILSWEFCARRHEELLPRRLVAPQVNQLVQVAQKCQSTINEGGADGVSQQDLQTNSNMVLTAGRQLANSLDLQSLNELGFSKRYVRCLQISEVVNSMKDLIDFCRENKTGPVEGLKKYPRHVADAKFPLQKMQEMEQLANVQGLPTDRNTLNKLMALHPCLSNQTNNNQPVVNRGALSGSAQAALALTNIQSAFMRQNSMNSSHNSLQQEATFNNSTPSPSSAQGPATFIPGSLQRIPSSGYSGTPPSRQQVSPQSQQLPQHPLGSNSVRQSQGDNSQALQHQMIQQLLQDISSGSGGMQQQSFVGQATVGSIARNNVGFGSNPRPPQVASSSILGGGTVGSSASRSNSFKAVSNSAPATNSGSDCFSQRPPEMSQGHLIQDDVIADIAQEFVDDSFFNGDLESMGFGWKHD
ncbi:hypothetical protein MLD38_025664 [Melastoma candidum]|uniref:Uncharacterized protein n=1 Tax=Melastoma candidum TaxID=119954 RepID=A0ACB9NXN4_9MYRT|nr:hypothetical protein MLD38_025664 [Melastoma candidum]